MVGGGFTVLYNDEEKILKQSKLPGQKDLETRCIVSAIRFIDICLDISLVVFFF